MLTILLAVLMFGSLVNAEPAAPVQVAAAIAAATGMTADSAHVKTPNSTNAQIIKRTPAESESKATNKVSMRKKACRVRSTV